MGYRFKVKVKVDGPTVMLAGFATPSVNGCTQFFSRLDEEAWKPTISFLRSP
jgi:hypothetical protein